MKTLFSHALLLLPLLFLAACSPAASTPTPTLLSTSALPPESPPAPPTETAAIPQKPDTQTDFTLHPASPVLLPGNEGDWDAGGVREAFVLAHENTYYMFYTGFAAVESRASAVGLATSSDGIAWEKYPGNPVFEPDNDGFDAFRVFWPIVYFDSGEWVMYFGGTPSASSGNAAGIGRATAPDPTGPWERLPDPVLSTGEAGRWDSSGIAPGPVFPTANGYRMYFSAFGSSAYIGMADSPDGITWTKYDDPATTTRAFAESDPVFGGDSGGWDRIVWGPAMYPLETRWIMVYHGDALSASTEPALGFASSPDGIVWARPVDHPILTHPGAHFPQAPALLRFEDTFFLYYTPILREPDRTEIHLATGSFP